MGLEIIPSDPRKEPVIIVKGKIENVRVIFGPPYDPPTRLFLDILPKGRGFRAYLSQMYKRNTVAIDTFRKGKGFKPGEELIGIDGTVFRAI